MEDSRLDRISKAFAQRRLSRRRTLAQGAAGLVAGTLAATGFSRAAAAQDATPEPDLPPPDGAHSPTMLFVQTYQSGSITPTEGVAGRYTLTLEQGHGQTIYFSDRPNRIVGAADTPEFLEDLGFPDDNPPNAALVFETAPGETDVAVVELFDPLYDPVTQGVTYEVEVLANWQDDLGVGLHEAPADLAALAPSFGAAHLFIDGPLGAGSCPNTDLTCYPAGSGGYLRPERAVGTIPSAEFGGWCLTRGFECYPCIGRPNAGDSWDAECERRFPEGCEITVPKSQRKYAGSCVTYPVCTSGNPYQTDCYPNY